MKRLFPIILLTLCLSSTSFSQETGWETGLTASGGAFFSSGKFSLLDKALRWHYGAGVYGRKFWKNNYGIELGLQYSQYSEYYRSDDLYFGSQVTPTGFTGTPSTYIYQEHYRYVEIPVRFVFKKDMGKFGIGCFAGVAPAFLVQARSRSILRNEEDPSDTRDDFSDLVPKVNLMADVGLVLRANVSKHFSIDTRPFYRISTLSANLNHTYRHHTLGVTLHSVWKF